MDDIDIFSAVLELETSAERRRYLDEACIENAAMRDRLEGLLQSFQDAGQFLEHSPSVSLVPNHSPNSAFPNRLGDEIGPYKLRKLLGEGGMGVVYEAGQEYPIHRTVALKIIKLGMDSSEVLRRFEAERQVLSVVDHPHIAKVLDAGTTATGRPYFVMEFVRGLPITEFCNDRLFTIGQRLELFLQVCRAIQHAHQKGIIHRDIKPTNVLVALHDETAVAKVIDFGIAKATAPQLLAETVYTAFTQMMGTPLYMSPEQAEMNAADVDTRTDVYSLGVLLYELLTGRTPFDSETLRCGGFDEMRRIIREVDPPTPSQRIAALDAEATLATAGHCRLDHRRLGKILRGELDWIVMKALDKDRNRRYESASALAADIGNHLGDKPVEARPAGWRRRANKWRRRNPVASVIIAASILLSTVLILGATWHNYRLTRALDVSNRLTDEAIERELTLRRELYVNDMRLAWGAVTAGDLAEARRLVERHRPQAGLADYAGFEWRHLSDLSRPALRTMAGHRANILGADVSSDGKWIVSGDKEGEVRIWELETGRLTKAWRYSDKEVTTVRFSPNGKFLATGGQDSAIRIWDANTWKQIATLEQHEMTVCSIVWSGDSKRLVSTGRDQMVHVWDAKEHRLLHSLPQHSDVVRAAAWSPDGRLLATTDGGAGVQVWDTHTWEKKGFLPGTGGGLICLAFSPDGRLLATSGYTPVIQVFDVVTMAEIARKVARGYWSLTFLDNETLVGGAGSEGLQFWRFDRERKALETLRERTGGLSTVRSVVGARKGALLVTATEDDRLLSVYDIRALLGREVFSLQAPLAIMPNRGLYLSAPEVGSQDKLAVDDGRLSVRGIDDGKAVAHFHRGFSKCSPAVSAAEDFIAIADNNRQIRILETKAWQPLKQLTLPAELSVDNLDFSANGEWLAAGCVKGVSGVWNVATGEWIQLKHDEGRGHALVQFSPRGKLLACASQDSDGVEIWDLDSRQLRTEFHVGQRIRAIAFSHDEKIVATGGHASDLSLWDSATGTRISVLSEHEGAVSGMSFSPDGRTLVSAGEDNTVRLWNLAARRELFTLLKDVPVREIGFRADGSLYVCEDNALSIFRSADTSSATSSPGAGPKRPSGR